MAIDECKFNFKVLGNSILPGYLNSLRRAMRSPQSMSDFVQRGAGIRTLLTKRGLEDDFAGCYVFISRKRPIYVGISRNVSDFPHMLECISA